MEEREIHSIRTLPDKTNTPGCLALFVTVNAIDNADALGDELRRSNYRKIEAFIQLLLSKCVCLSFCDCSSIARKALAFAHNKTVHLTTREVHFASSILVSLDLPYRYDATKRLVGDVCYEEALGVSSAITPVPGGDGPMTIAILLCNAAKRISMI
uniref:Tetrahydrofolate dehydrogenase/cyclohydrolase NAD(P)-binding domain-containing protein n=1 Tax=Brassica campestris TaxID=3711 RepID=M4C7A4_BRACM